MPQLECDAPLCKASGGTFAAPGTVTELAGIQDLSIDSAMDKLDASSRGSRFKKNWLGMRDLIVTGKVLKTNNDADFEYLRDAHNNRTAIHLIALDGPKDSAGSEGPNADWFVDTFKRAGDLGGLVVYEFTLVIAKTANEPTWYEVSGS